MNTGSLPIGRLREGGPAACVLLLAAAYLGWVFFHSGADPLVFADLGTRFSAGDPAGTEGYDGQFNYYIALDPDPERVAPLLDVPAYRYQRILYPLLARLLALGNPEAIPWTLLGINLICLTAAVFLLGELLEERGAGRWGAVLFGLWAGLIGAVRLDLAEPLALLLVILALRVAGLSLERKPVLCALFLGLALLAKETVLPFLGGWIAWLLIRRRFHNAVWISLAAAPFLLLQIRLWSVFGSPGIGSGGAGATSFEVLPFAGLFRIAQASLPAFLALSVVYLPGLLFPAVYGLAAPLADFARRRANPESLLLIANALMIAFAPFSTFREPLGILRLACGLILCMGLYAASRKLLWWNKVGLFGLAYLAFLR